MINKIDRGDARPDAVLDEVFDLFASLDATDEQLDFPVLYASGRDGWCTTDLENGARDNLHPLLELVLDHVPAPDVDTEAPFTMLSTLLGADPYLGRTLTGRIYSGKAKVNMPVKALSLDGKTVETFRLTKLMAFNGIDREPVDEAVAGDIVCIAGMQKTSVADTICDTSVSEPVPSDPVDPPTMAVTITVNDSPYAGQEGKKLTSTMIRERLFAEAETNVAIRVSESDGKDAFELAGRGELQLGVLIETMRREGFEMTVSRPRVIYKEDENGNRLEPYEEVTVDVDDEFSGAVVEKMTQRKAEISDMRQSGAGRARIVFKAPSRSLIGYQSQFLTDTRGTGLMNRIFDSYGPYKGEIGGRRNGALISNGTGEAVAYAIFNLQDRGIMMVDHQEKVYEGMIIGEHNRENDLEVNILKGKQLTNVRASGTDEAVKITTPTRMSLEEMIAYINDDELVEVTPENLRLRKVYLKEHERKTASRQKAKG